MTAFIEAIVHLNNQSELVASLTPKSHPACLHPARWQQGELDDPVSNLNSCWSAMLPHFALLKFRPIEVSCLPAVQDNVSHLPMASKAAAAFISPSRYFSSTKRRSCSANQRQIYTLGTTLPPLIKYETSFKVILKINRYVEHINIDMYLYKSCS